MLTIFAGIEYAIFGFRKYSLNIVIQIKLTFGESENLWNFFLLP